MLWTAFLIFRLVFSIVSWFDSSLTPSMPLLLWNTASRITVVNSESLVRKQDPCHVPRKSSGPSPAPSPKQSTACPGARASGTPNWATAHYPWSCRDKTVWGCDLSTPSLPRAGFWDPDKQTRMQEIVIRGSWGLMGLSNESTSLVSADIVQQRQMTWIFIQGYSLLYFEVS